MREAPSQPGKPAARTLLVISAEPGVSLRAEIAAGGEPRRDYFELQRALNADLLTPVLVRGTPFGRLLAHYGGRALALAWAAFRRRHDYDVIYTDAESVGLPFALLLKLRGARGGRPRHVMLTHYLSSGRKRLLFRLGAASHIDTLIVHSCAQRALAQGVLRVPPERVVRLPYFADQHFWQPRPGEAPSDPPMICSVGLEFRDYATLVDAARELPVHVCIAAASSWSHHSAFAGSPELPPNVAVASYRYAPLRELYAASRFVVVPLRQVDNQAGITVILEAMAMGKAVIVTATRGQTDVVRDRRNGGRGRIEREWWPGFVDDPAVTDTLRRLPTGFYVAPGDSAELRRAVQYLLDHPQVADELGRNGRRVVEALFTLDAFTARFAAAIRDQRLPEGMVRVDAPTV
jgi:glycosyltransferase involved in cell wall biosynthesis